MTLFKDKSILCEPNELKLITYLIQTAIAFPGGEKYRPNKLLLHEKEKALLLLLHEGRGGDYGINYAAMAFCMKQSKYRFCLAVITDRRGQEAVAAAPLKEVWEKLVRLEDRKLEDGRYDYTSYLWVTRDFEHCKARKIQDD